MKTHDGSLDPTLTATEAPTAAIAHDETALDAQGPRDSAPAIPPDKYALREMLGRGGMGEVLLAEDKTFGREVAIKRMRAAEPSADSMTRFLREVHIQARLDHPAIVPVHELGRDMAGRPYFTMKRLTGVTLYELLKAGTKTQQQLLRAFVDVCLAVEFAHQRGIVHRDLKPSNVMLGNFGEVYVLDWGVARVVGDIEKAGVAIESYEGETQQGSMLGTPGYMSPEQMRGDEVTPATDVYALGAILFEILVGAALHPRGAAMESTLSDTVFVPTRRAPNRAIPPELDGACAAALVAKPEKRQTARELADAVQRYLDGDRDVERRHTLAAEHLATARAAFDNGDHGEAMRFAGRALALHPESRDAASLVTTLMLEPPNPPPPALQKRLDDIDRDDTERQGRYATLAMLGWLAFMPAIAIIDRVNNWSLFFGIVGLLLVMMGGATYIARKRIARITWAVLGNAILLAFITRVFSPIIVAPALAVATTTALSSFPLLRTRYVVAGMCVGILVPLALEFAGVLPRTVEFGSNTIVIAADALAFSPHTTPILLACIHAATILIIGLVVRTLVRVRRDAQRKLKGQSWMLEQLLPAERA